MVSGARTFGLGETFAEPQVLPPPPVRHALLAFVVALAAILHIGMAGWSEIHNGAEGLYAASAREMLASGSAVFPRSAGVALPNEPPLLHWLLLGSYKVFGVNPVAARLPVALAFVACVALTFLIGERLANYWRGFVASAIYVGSCGAYMWPRFVTPEPLVAACVAGAMLCAIAAYQRKQTRRAWFVGLWICAAGAYLARGAFALLLLALIIGLPAICFREARMRFRAVVHPWGMAAFAALVLPWLLLVRAQSAGSLLTSVWVAPLQAGTLAGQLPTAGIGSFLSSHFLWWFPALVLVIPAVLLSWRKVIRPHEFTFADALPLAWAIAGLPAVLFASRLPYGSIVLWSGFALMAAMVWERTPRRLQLAGIVTVAVGGIAAAIGIAHSRLVLPNLGRSAFQQGDADLLTISAVALTICCAAAAYLVWQNRGILAITTLLVASVPIGLGGAEAIARNSPYLSFARVAQYLQSPAARGANVLFEGPAVAASSLLFYLDQPFSTIADPAADRSTTGDLLRPADALERMAQPARTFLIVHKDRTPFWQAQLTARFHIYHQVTTCGAYAVINNHP